MKKLFIISLCLLCLCGCKGKDDEKKYEKITESEIETIVERELYVLWNKNNIDEVTNNERLTLGFERYAIDNSLSYEEMGSIKASDVEDSFKKTSIGSLKLNHEDVKGSFKITTCEHTEWKYDKEKSLYVNEPDGHGVCAANAIYQKLQNLEEKDGKYIATYKYIFDYGCEGDDSKIYGSYEDAINEKNSLGETPNNTATEEEFNAKIASKYDEIKDSLMTYTYTFEKVNNKITLVDFKRN